MWFNSRRSERPHLGLTCECKPTKVGRSRGFHKAAAWLSSARAVGCWFKYHNERNPSPMLNFSLDTAPQLCLEIFLGRVEGRKVGTTSSQHGAYAQGHTHPTMAKNNEMRAGNCKPISEISPQFRLRAATRPHEAGIASNRGSAGRGEYVLVPCTHRPSSQQSRGCPKLRAIGMKANSAMGTKS